jgi:hypothetical protein
MKATRNACSVVAIFSVGVLVSAVQTKGQYTRPAPSRFSQGALERPAPSSSDLRGRLRRFTLIRAAVIGIEVT